MLLSKVEIILEKMNCSIPKNLWRPSNIRKQLACKVVNTFYGPPPRGIYPVGVREKNI
jgi:hypothetical protein